MNKKLISKLAVAFLLAAGLAAFILWKAGVFNTQSATLPTTVSTSTETQTQGTTENPGYGVVETLPTGGAEVTAVVTEPSADEDVTPTTHPTIPADPWDMTFEAYLALTPQEQVDFSLLFPTPPDYIRWYNEAKAIYDDKEVTPVTGPVVLEPQ